jgi:N-acetylglucosamine-6-phosphate deacetylase
MKERCGFVDIQNNGWMGTDFTAPGLTVERVLEITRDLVSRGTLAFCPTVITGNPDVYRENFGVIAKAMRDRKLGRHILGIHLEGPFISPEPGAVGAHPKEYVLAPDPATFDKFQEWAGGAIRILTVAPERPGCEALIRHVTSKGVAVSMGHHLASDEDMERAVQAGATLCTHVGNGIPNMINRHQNPLWWQFANDRVYGLFITDGHHLPADLITVALRAKTVKRFIVTSDASPLAGMPPGAYTIFGTLPVVIDDKGLIYSEQSKSLAGSHSTMLECMNHLASLGLLTEKELWTVGLKNPLKALGLKPRDLAGLKGPAVTFQDGRFEIAK